MPVSSFRRYVYSHACMQCVEMRECHTPIHMSMHMSMHMSIHMHLHVSIHMCIRIHIHMSIHMSAHVSEPMLARMPRTPCPHTHPQSMRNKERLRPPLPRLGHNYIGYYHMGHNYIVYKERRGHRRHGCSAPPDGVAPGKCGTHRRHRPPCTWHLLARLDCLP